MKYFIGIALAAIVCVVIYVGYLVVVVDRTIDGHTEFQAASAVAQDQQGWETLYYVGTTDGRVFRFAHDRHDWVIVRANCRYSADEYLHIDSVPVITNLRLLGCVG